MGELARAIGSEREAEVLGSAGRIAPPAGATPALPGLEAVVTPGAEEDPVAVVWAAYVGERVWVLGPKYAAHPPRLDDGRRAVIRARLKESWKVEDLCAAVRGIWHDEFHVSKDYKYATLEVALRKASSIERLRESDPGPRKPRPEQPVQVQPARPRPERPPITPERQKELMKELMDGLNA